MTKHLLQVERKSNSGVVSFQAEGGVSIEKAMDPDSGDRVGI
jgi:hypothetical protein